MQLFESIMAFAEVYGRIEQHLVVTSKPKELTTLQYKMLLLLIGCQSKTPSQIAECLNLSLPNTSRELRVLENLDLIKKDPDQKDKRKVSIRVTDHGNPILAGAQEAMIKAVEDQFSTLTDQERSTMTEAFNTLTHLFYKNL
jgi:DNA-binding MarR family transcriptional regulator